MLDPMMMGTASFVFKTKSIRNRYRLIHFCIILSDIGPTSSTDEGDDDGGEGGAALDSHSAKNTSHQAHQGIGKEGIFTQQVG